MYTSPSKHPDDSTMKDIYHPLFDTYDVDLLFSSDNHNYQRTFPLKYNSNADNSNPIIIDNNQDYYNNNLDNTGAIYLITGPAERSHYAIEGQTPFVAKQDNKHFGFLNIGINGDTLEVTFYANKPQPNYNYMDAQNKIIDQFTISKID